MTRNRQEDGEMTLRCPDCGKPDWAPDHAPECRAGTTATPTATEETPMQIYAYEFTPQGGQIALIDDPSTPGYYALWDTARQQYARRAMSRQAATIWAADAPYVSEEGQHIFWGRQVRPFPGWPAETRMVALADALTPCPRCGRPALDGRATCGRVACGEDARELREAERRRRT